jgi:hypothetical protein
MVGRPLDATAESPSRRDCAARRRSSIYALDATPLQEVDTWLDHFRAFWHQRLDALGTEIARGKRTRSSH